MKKKDRKVNWAYVCPEQPFVSQRNFRPDQASQFLNKNNTENGDNTKTSATRSKDESEFA